MKKFIFITIILIVSKRNFSQIQNFNSWFYDLKTDTISDNNGNVYEIRAKKNEDSLIYKSTYYETGKIKSKQLLVSRGILYMPSYFREYSFYESGNIKRDSLIDRRKSNNQIKMIISYFQNGKMETESFSKGKKVKGRGIMETYSWGTTWVTRRKIYNEFNEIIYDEKSTWYYR
jgi:hypothetical protein